MGLKQCSILVQRLQVVNNHRNKLVILAVGFVLNKDCKAYVPIGV